MTPIVSAWMVRDADVFPAPLHPANTIALGIVSAIRSLLATCGQPFHQAPHFLSVDGRLTPALTNRTAHGEPVGPHVAQGGDLGRPERAGQREAGPRRATALAEDLLSALPPVSDEATGNVVARYARNETPEIACAATRALPIVPPAPPTFSITIDWPSDFDIASVTMRATISLGPPAGNGTTTVIACVG